MASSSRAEKQYRSITKLIVEELRQAILTGRLAPGERLSEEKLAASLKVSPVPLRDALRRLEAEGYVNIASHGEIAISKPTVDEVEDIYAVAGALEGLAARLAAERASAEEIARLRELHRSLKEAYQQKDVQRYFDINGKFHRFIAEIARNERLYRLISEMRQEIRKTRLLALQLPQRLDFSMREHDQLLDAFLKRNPDLAESVVLKHLANQMAAIKGLLQAEEEVVSHA
jgi:DNA-binding GntR family transcriptional regulator